jgi:hypothetical protein
MLPLNVQLPNVGEEAELNTPPPWYSAVFPLNVQFSNVGEEEEALYIPPPSANAPPWAEFPLNVQCVRVGEAQIL